MKAEIIHNSLWGAKHGLLILKTEGFAENCRPGQMCMLSVSGVLSTDPLLRRPFAPYDINIAENTVSIIYAIAGRGTLLLSKQPAGAVLSLSLPHGKPFTLAKNADVALVAGGVGIGPMHFLAKMLHENGCRVTLYYGARTAGELYPPLRDEPAPHRWVLCTEDGSLGNKGFATSLLEQEIGSYDMCYTCGPKPMMKIVQTICSAARKPLEVSLEETMACGIGVCAGCMVKIHEDGAPKMQRCCTEGPVFDGHCVVW